MENIFSQKQTILQRAIRIILTVSMASMLTGCLSILGTIRSTPLGCRLVLATHHPKPSPTATPFQPLESSPTPRYTATRALTSTNRAPTATRIPTSTPVPPDPFSGWISILVLGSDARSAGGYRTDVIELVMLQPDLGLVSIISFPRDLYVNVPGVGNTRINTAMPQGGFPLLVSTFQTNWGVKPEYYMMTNFRGFVGIVNSLGGIDVMAAKYLSDRCDLPQGVRGWCSVGPGKVHMDGNMALWYSRSRYSTNDIDRNRRAQEVLEALFRKLMSLNAVSRAPDLYSLFIKNVETNISLNFIIQMIGLSPKFFSESYRIRRYAVTYSEATDYITPGGGMVLLPDNDAIRAILRKAVTP